MRDRIGAVGLVMLLIALASFLAAANGHGPAACGFFSGG